MHKISDMMVEVPITPEQTAAIKAYLAAGEAKRQAEPPAERYLVRRMNVNVLGKQYTGRHGVISWLCLGAPHDWYDPTDNGTSRRVVSIQGQTVMVEFHQSLGDDASPNVMSAHYENMADAYMLVYDVADRNSFEVIYRLHKEQLGGPSVKKPIWVVANKHGQFNKNRDVTEWAVTPQEGYQFAASIGARYRIVASNTGQNLGEGLAVEIGNRILLSWIEKETLNPGHVNARKGRSRWSIRGMSDRIKSTLHTE